MILVSRLLIFICFVLFFVREKPKSYIIVAGDITCKACVIQLYDHLSKKIKKDKLLIALRNKGNIILNESGPDYYKKELPKAIYIFLPGSNFPNKEKYPYLLTIYKNDTLKIPYDSLFFEEGLTIQSLR